MNIQKIFNEALNYLQQGNMIEGEKLLKKIIKQNSNHYPSLTNLGTLYLIQNKTNEGIKLIEKSVSIYPDQPVALLNLGGYFYESKDYQKSIHYSKLACKYDNNQIKAKINLGHAYKKIGNISESLKSYLQINLQYYNDENLAINIIDNLITLKKYKDAIILTDKHDLKTKHILFLKSICLKELGDFETAIDLLKQISKEDESDEYLLELIDMLYLHTGYKHTLSYIKENYKNNKFIIKFILGKIEYCEENFESATAILKDCLDEKPDHVDSMMYLAYIYSNTHQYDMAIKEYEKIERLIPKLSSDRNIPEAMMNLGSLYLFLGDYLNGWNYYQHRFNTNTMGLDIKNHYHSILVNQDSKEQKIEENTNLLLLQEQGIGDLLIYLHSVRDNIHKFKSITLACDSRLFKVIKNSIPGIFLIDFKKEIQLKDFDSYAYIGNFCANYYKDINLINGEPLIKINIAKKDNPNFRVGISWKSKNKSYKNKSTKLSNFIPILKNNNIEVLSLQYGDVQKEIDEVLSMGGKINETSIDLFNDIDGICIEIEKCDLIITTSNVTAHLAGSMGKKTYLLIPSRYNDGRIWYWTNNYNKNRTPWYDSIKIYEVENNNWDGVIEEINKELSS
jgi:tetratricopeptide (TPR) repeat protein